MTQTLVMKLEEFLVEKEAQGHDISTLSNTTITLFYYSHLGVTSSDTLKDWFIKIADGVVPPYESITRAIRKCRENNKRWRKANKEEQIENAKKEIGYD